MTNLGDVLTRENAGRQTISRFQMQFRAASYACLQILENKEIDRVYCDYHDDFVVRHKSGEKFHFHFYQVKTHGKANHLWSVLEVLGIKKTKFKIDAVALKKIKDSFLGKMFLHTINFKDSCQAITFLTNVQINDDIVDLLDDRPSETYKNKYLTLLFENFREVFELDSCYTDSNIKENIRKLKFEPGIRYLNPEGNEFFTKAREAIYNYSEIDIIHTEMEEIIESLVTLIEKKSFVRISGKISAQELDEKAGVGIDNLLDILAISKSGYFILINGGDKKALKSASIIQRRLIEAGATSEMIEYATRQKVEWDIWLREKRHTIPEFDINFLLQALLNIQIRWTKTNGSFESLYTEISEYLSNLKETILKENLTKDLLLGGVLSLLVLSGAL